MALPEEDLSPARRGHAADDVFEKIAAAILRGQLQPGEALPPERVLAERFGVSRIIVRQAVHRLADCHLVRVRQGGSTLVLDPRDAADLRVAELDWRLGPGSASDVYDFTERQIMQGFGILRVAERRGSPSEFAGVAALIEDYCTRGATAEELPAFEERLWKQLAAIGGNRLYVFETNWWFRVIAVQPGAFHPIVAPPHTRIHFFRELARRLVSGEDAAAFYLEISDVLLQSIQPKRRPR
jgi:DNA-binding FadR family transcriptional regulator